MSLDESKLVTAVNGDNAASQVVEVAAFKAGLLQHAPCLEAHVERLELAAR